MYRAARSASMWTCVLALCALLGCSFTTAHFSEIHLARAIDEEGRPTVKTTTFHRSDPVLYCCAVIANTPSETVVKAVWAYQGPDGRQVIDSAEVSIDEDRWLFFSLRPAGAGLPYGNYVVDLFIMDKHQSSQSFTIAPRLAKGPVTEAALATTLNEAYAPVETATSFAPSVPVIYAPVYADEAAIGTQLSAIWYQDEPGQEAVIIATTDYVPTAAGWVGFSLTPSSPLPPGAYHVDILYANEPLTTLPFTVKQ